MTLEPIGDIATVSLSSGPAIPDSVVSRPSDNNTAATQSTTFGVRIESDVTWPDIGAQISSNSAGFTRAYVYRVSDGQLLGETDISGLTAGDSFTITNVDLQPADGTDATKYNLVMDAEGADWDPGYYDNSSFPYSSSDGDLRIINGGQGSTGTNANAISYVQVGNVGF